MVKIRVTVTVLPEDVYLAAQDGHLASGARSAQARKFMVPCESPEAWTIGQFANKIKDAYRKTYRGEDLGTIKYIKDEDDADLHTDLSVYDALVNSGDEAMNIRDQRAKITIIQEQGLPLRGGSVLPDLSALRYQIPRPPPPPLFSTSSQAPPSARKRSRDAAFGEEESMAPWPRIPPHQRPRIPMASLDPGEHAPAESVEHDALEQDAQASSQGRAASADLIQDAQLSVIRRAANVGYEMADHNALADVEVKSESPDPQVPLQHLKPTSRSSLEVLESVTTTTKSILKPAFEDLIQRRISRDSVPTSPSRKASASQGTGALPVVTMPEGLQPGLTAHALLPEQAQLQTWNNQPHGPITPPSDASPAVMRGRLPHPAPKVVNSAKSTGASNKFKPGVPRRDVFEPQSSIEDSQMSPQPNKKSTADVDSEATLISQARTASRPKSHADKAKAPLSQTARFDDRNISVSLGKRAPNQLEYSFGETLSLLSDADHDSQNYQGNAYHEPEATVAVLDTHSDELSTDESIGDLQGRNTGHSKTLSTLKHRPSRRVASDDDSASLSTELIRSSDETDGDSNKENRLSGRDKTSSDRQMHDQVPDAEMEDVSSGDNEILSASGSRRLIEKFQGVELPARKIEVSTSKDQTTIDILNGGGFVGDKLDMSVGNIESSQSNETSLRHPVELQDNTSLMADSQATSRQRRRKKKSNIQGDISRFDPRANPLGSLDGKEVTTHDPVDPPRRVLGEIGRASNHASLRSERQSPTSTGSAGDQLQANLQASTLERLSIKDATTMPSHDSAYSVANLKSPPDVGKVYEGVIVAFEAGNARVALKGFENELCGTLHRNAIAEQPIKGPLSKLLSLQQVVKVKVTKVKNGEIKLSLRGVDQSTGLVKVAPKKDREPGKALEHAGKRNQKQLSLGSDLQTTSSTQNDPGSLGIGDEARNNAESRLEDRLLQPEETHKDEACGDDAETTHSIELAETPEKEDHRNQQFSSSFTNTPGSSKRMAANVQTAGTLAALEAEPVKSGQQQSVIKSNDVPSVYMSHTGDEDMQDVNAPEGRVQPSFSALQSKAILRKSRPKTKPEEKQSKSRNSTGKVAADIEQETDLPREGGKASQDDLTVSLGDNKSLLERPPATATTEVANEEYIAFPPTMTREQFLAQRQANAEAIARRNAAAARKASIQTPGELAKAQTVAQSAKSAVDKQKDKPVNRRPASAFETPPPSAHSADKRTTKNKQLRVEQGSSDAGTGSLIHGQQHSGGGRASIDRQQSKNVTAPSTKSGKTLKIKDVEQGQMEPATLDSQATGKPNLSRSPSANLTKAANTTSSSTTPKVSSTPKARIPDVKAQVVKPVTAKAIQAGKTSNSKALSLAELKARKEAAKKSSNAPSSSLTSYRSTPTANKPRVILTTRADSDLDSDSDSDSSESESSSDYAKLQSSGAVASKKTGFQKAVPKPDPTIRDRSMSVDVDDSDESD